MIYIFENHYDTGMNFKRQKKMIGTVQARDDDGRESIEKNTCSG